MTDNTDLDSAPVVGLGAKGRGPARCGNEDCKNGWVPVTEEWAVEQSGGDPVRFAAALNSVVPCPVDAPERFQRWLEGHYDVGHHCDECDPKRRHAR